MTETRPEPDKAPDAAPKRRNRRVVRPGAEREQIAGVTADERGGHGDNDERLLQDVPPHWGRR
ncbi:transcriptional regulator [Xylanimonas protaetiae]|uniref:Transcriptional regulator n=1 Tax=Xylanimonas protaetiae TaxID=2509457 RepID=A0A4P6F2Z8_9MICO|nr:transcriptional regulator [Xylanimonas protaetiae]QAY69113.1 transcriptional regulator [Xylanimonas protaetiae]